MGSPPASDKIQLQVCDTPQGEQHTNPTTVSEDDAGRCSHARAMLSEEQKPLAVK